MTQGRITNNVNESARPCAGSSQKNGTIKLLLTAAILFIFLSALSAQETNNGKWIRKTDSGLKKLVQIKKAEPEKFSVLSKSVADPDGVEASIRFKSGLTAEDIKFFSQNGVSFKKTSAKDFVKIGDNIYRAKIAWDSIDSLLSDKRVELIESLFGHNPVAPRDVAIPEIAADQAWLQINTLGDNVSGKGMLIGDLDWGCDIFHPDFFRADGDLYDWIDVNGNNQFDPRVDVVDLNNDDIATTPSEFLAFFDGIIKEGHHNVITNSDGIFQADLDWLYNDKNNNGQRDYGVDNGFTESDPTYGEVFFLVVDENDNHQLDVGEKLRALKTCKIKYYFTMSRETFTRGVNLINLSSSSYSGERASHGTGVCGILAGQERGYKRKFVGVAPDADIAHANVQIDYDYISIMEWMNTKGVDVMLHEYSEWTSQFMDGSSNTETAITNNANNGIPQVIPAGNLGRSDKHALADVPASGTVTVGFDTPSPYNIRVVYLTVLWRDSDNTMTLTITDPNSNIATLGAIPGTLPNTQLPNTKIYDSLNLSSRGTMMRDLNISANSGYLPKGNWTLKITNAQDTTETVDLFVIDNQSSWYSNGSEFTTHYTKDGNITWPCYADNSIGIASYATRGIDGSDPYYSSALPGDLSGFSGRGARIDGANVIDIACPGNYDIISPSNPASGYPYGSYLYFSGTSAAGPFAAATCALILQADPGLSSLQVCQYIRETARKDSHTGLPPDENLWGGGKLNTGGAVEKAVNMLSVNYWNLY